MGSAIVPERPWMLQLEEHSYHSPYHKPHLLWRRWRPTKANFLLPISRQRLVLPIGQRRQTYPATCLGKWHVPSAQLVLSSGTSECTLTNHWCCGFLLCARVCYHIDGYHRQLICLSQWAWAHRQEWVKEGHGRTRKHWGCLTKSMKPLSIVIHLFPYLQWIA